MIQQNIFTKDKPNIRLRILLAKEYTRTENGQKGLALFSKMFFDNMASIVWLIKAFFSVIGGILLAFSGDKHNANRLFGNVHSEKSELSEAESKEFVEKFLSPILELILEEIWQNRYIVNPVAVFIVEMAHQYFFPDEENGKTLGKEYISEVSVFWDIIKEKIDFTELESTENQNDSSLEVLVPVYSRLIKQIFDIGKTLATTKYEETLALTLSQTPIYHLKDLLSNQERASLYHGDLKMLVLSIVAEHGEIFEENQVREIVEWSTNFPEIDPISHLPKIKKAPVDTRLIRISTKLILQIATHFQNYFDDSDFIAFCQLLEGSSISYKIKFNGKSSVLIFAFRELHDLKLIKGDKKETEQWLMKYFEFWYKGKYFNLKPSSVRTAMSRSNFKAPIGKINFNFDNLNEIKDTL